MSHPHSAAFTAARRRRRHRLRMRRAWRRYEERQRENAENRERSAREWMESGFAERKARRERDAVDDLMVAVWMLFAAGIVVVLWILTGGAP